MIATTHRLAGKTNQDRTLPRVDLVVLLTAFLAAFGRQPLTSYANFRNMTFGSPEDFDAADFHLALQIAVNTVSECPERNQKIAGLEQRIHEMLGDLKTRTEVRILGYPFVIEPPAKFA